MQVYDSSGQHTMAAEWSACQAALMLKRSCCNPAWFPLLLLLRVQPHRLVCATCALLCTRCKEAQQGLIDRLTRMMRKTLRAVATDACIFFTFPGCPAAANMAAYCTAGWCACAGL